jgi:two-component system, NtrC family, response regulator AtoC
VKTDPHPLELVAFLHERAVACALPRAGKVVIGRDEGSDVRLDHPSVSRAHAVLHLGPPLRVEDLGSENGTLVRGAHPPPEGDTHRFRSAPRELTEIALGDGIVFGAVAAVVRRSTAGRAAGAAATDEGDLDVIAADPATRALHEQAARAASSPISVLVLGETGVGKEVLARLVHRRSPRAAGPFVGVNCAALSASLLESELFGHEKGAFTGAHEARPGLFEAAHHGTIFLDEVGELPPASQVKLLRVLEERSVLRVGARAARPVDFRLVSASNRDLEAEVARGAFRQDLFFRLSGFTLTLPPLRERAREIAPLARAFLRQAGPRYGRATIPEVSAEALAALERHAWPGNLRELRNVVERALVLCDGAILLPEHLPAKITGTPGLSDAREPERRRILDALELCAGNQSRAAKVLGISRRTLVTRLDELDIARPRKGR